MQAVWHLLQLLLWPVRWWRGEQATAEHDAPPEQWLADRARIEAEHGAAQDRGPAPLHPTHRSPVPRQFHSPDHHAATAPKPRPPRHWLQAATRIRRGLPMHADPAPARRAEPSDRSYTQGRSGHQRRAVTQTQTQTPPRREQPAAADEPGGVGQAIISDHHAQQTWHATAPTLHTWRESSEQSQFAHRPRQVTHVEPAGIQTEQPTYYSSEPSQQLTTTHSVTTREPSRKDLPQPRPAQPDHSTPPPPQQRAPEQVKLFQSPPRDTHSAPKPPHRDRKALSPEHNRHLSHSDPAARPVIAPLHYQDQAVDDAPARRTRQQPQATAKSLPPDNQLPAFAGSAPTHQTFRQQSQPALLNHQHQDQHQDQHQVSTLSPPHRVTAPEPKPLLQHPAKLAKTRSKRWWARLAAPFSLLRSRRTARSAAPTFTRPQPAPQHQAITHAVAKTTSSPFAQWPSNSASTPQPETRAEPSRSAADNLWPSLPDPVDQELTQAPITPRSIVSPRGASWSV